MNSVVLRTKNKLAYVGELMENIEIDKKPHKRIRTSKTSGIQMIIPAEEIEFIMDYKGNKL